MKDKFVNDLNRVLYSADHHTVENLLSQLALPEHLHTRLGHQNPEADESKAAHDLRLVAADALQENDREGEASLLRDPTQHVMVNDGRVVPARLTHEFTEPKYVYLDRDHDTPLGPETDYTVYRYWPTTAYMIGRRWGGSPRWAIDDRHFHHFNSLDELKQAFPTAKHFSEEFPNEQWDEVQRPLKPEEMHEVPADAKGVA